MLDSTARDLDMIKKSKGGKKETKDVMWNYLTEVGDKVLLRIVVLSYKLTSVFDTTENKVLKRFANEIKMYGGWKNFRVNKNYQN